MFKTNSPRLILEVNTDACMERQVQLGDVYGALQGSMGSRYANDFNRFGRTWQVNIQSDDRYRDQIEDVKRLQGAKRQRRDGSAWHAADGKRRQRAFGDYTLQHVSGRGGERQRHPWHE